MQRFKTARDGHAPAESREAFTNWAEQQYQDGVPLDRKTRGQLWNCTDIVPRWVLDLFDLPAGLSYAAAVRRLS